MATVELSEDANQNVNFLAEFYPSQPQQVQLASMSQQVHRTQNTQLGDYVQRAEDQQQSQTQHMEFDKELFLQAIREFKCLWDTNDPNYKNRTMKANAWNSLSRLFNQEVVYLQKAFKNLKDALKKCLDKRKALTRSGAAASTLPTCKYFEVMRFLHDKTSNLETHSNIELAQSNLDTSFEISIDSQRPTSLSPVPSTCSGITSISEEGSLKATKRKRSKNEQSDPVLDQITEMDDKMLGYLGKMKEKNNEKDEAALFCDSLVPVLRDMHKQNLRLAKLKIQQLLYELEFV